MLNDEVFTFPNNDQEVTTKEPPFVRYVRATLAVALGNHRSHLSLGSHGGYDILTFSAEVEEAFQWRSIYCRPTKEASAGKNKFRYGLRCIGEATGVELRDAMISAGVGTTFTVSGGSEYRKMAHVNRRGWIFDPRTTSMDCQLSIEWAAGTPNWQQLGEAVEGMRVLAALRL